MHTYTEIPTIDSDINTQDNSTQTDISTSHVQIINSILTVEEQRKKNISDTC